MSRLTLLYLHGFLSSPASAKARQTCQYAEQDSRVGDIIVPTLKSGPAATISSLLEMLSDTDRSALGIIGSSLGGFYATVLAEQLQVPAVLINPAVHPYQYWQNYLGKHHNFHDGEVHEVTREHVQQLRDLDPAAISRPEQYRVYLQRHDEVLDYRQAVRRYGEANCVVRDDGNHAYANFDSELPAVFDFLIAARQHN